MPSRASLPTADLPGYVPESDPEEDPEEDDDEDPKEDPADGGDDGDDEDESSDDDEDDDVDIEDDKEEEEHPTPTGSTAVALPTADHAPSAEETEPFKTDESAAIPPPHPAYRVARLLAIPTPPPSPLSSWSSLLPHISSPPLPPILSPLLVRLPLTVFSSHPVKSNAPSSGTPPLLPIPAPTSSPPLLLPFTNRREDRPEVTLLPRKRLGIDLGPSYEVGESSSAAAARLTGGSRSDYGFVTTLDMEIRRDPERYVGFRITDTWDEMLKDMPAIDDTELGRRMTEFATRVRQDTDKIYTRRQAAITELLAADCRRQAQFIEALKLLKRLQTQMTKFESQQGPAKGPAQPDAPEEAGSSS
ncbi:hypothetical protein Tco_1227077 [Tanacetum coccineum]